MVQLNSKGQTTLVAIMLAVVFIILALAFATPIKQFSDTARNSSTNSTVGLDCSNSSISTYDKANCVATDLFNPYFIGFLIFMAGVIIAAKITTS